MLCDSDAKLLRNFGFADPRPFFVAEDPQLAVSRRPLFQLDIFLSRTIGRSIGAIYRTREGFEGDDR